MIEIDGSQHSGSGTILRDIACFCALTGKDVHLGSDMAGAPRRSAEFIGRQTAKNLLEDLESKAAVDRHLADQLIPYAALAEGSSSYRIPFMTEHISSRLWLARDLLGAGTEVRGNLLRITGIGYRRQSRHQAP